MHLSGAPATALIAEKILNIKTEKNKLLILFDVSIF